MNHEYILSDTDFTTFNWTLSGTELLGFDYTGAPPNPNETVRVDIYGGNLTPSVPDVGTKYLVGLGLALVLFGNPRLQSRMNRRYPSAIENDAPRV